MQQSQPETRIDYLRQLNDAVAQLVTRPAIQSIIDTLKERLQDTSEPFVWSTINLGSITAPLPDIIRSCWIFVLKRDVPSGCHYHPNSIQHMVMIEGEATSKIGENTGYVKRFGEPGYSLEDIWCVIPEGVSHEFFPTGGDMVVVSFHTTDSSDLEEISCDSGATRIYEPQSPANENRCV